MKTTCILFAGAATAAVLPLTGTARADPPPLEEKTKNIIAVQIRKQGFECNGPEKAERDPTSGNPDDPIWTLTCENAVYRVHLVPNMAAKVERLSDGQP